MDLFINFGNIRNNVFVFNDTFRTAVVSVRLNRFCSHGHRKELLDLISGYRVLCCHNWEGHVSVVVLGRIFRQFLVRSRSNYFSSIAIELLLQDGQRKLCGRFGRDRSRSNYFARDGQHALILIFFQYAYRTVRPDFRRLPIGLYIDKHVFIGQVLRNTPPDVLHFHSNKIYHRLKDTLSYCFIPTLITLIDFCT